jgi:hypothetical protein
MWHATRTNKHHTIGSIIRLDVVLQVTALDGLNVLLRSEDGASEGLTLEGGGVEVVEHNLLKLLVDLLLFAEDDVALALDGLWLEF